jgi:YD repeat-containing protein
LLSLSHDSLAEQFTFHPSFGLLNLQRSDHINSQYTVEYDTAGHPIRTVATGCDTITRLVPALSTAGFGGEPWLQYACLFSFSGDIIASTQNEYDLNGNIVQSTKTVEYSSAPLLSSNGETTLVFTYEGEQLASILITSSYTDHTTQIVFSHSLEQTSCEWFRDGVSQDSNALFFDPQQPTHWVLAAYAVNINLPSWVTCSKHAEYDTRGRLISIVQPSSNRYDFEYEGGHLVASTYTGLAANTDRTVTSYAYSVNGDLIEKAIHRNDVLWRRSTFEYESHVVTRIPSAYSYIFPEAVSQQRR